MSYSFSVVGCGHIGKRHIAVLQDNPLTRLVAVCDSNIELKEDPGIPQGVPFYNSLEELLESGQAGDTICIATPNGCHEAMALQALRRGKNVVIEKPMALTRSGCEKILYEALNQHRQVFCVMQNRYSPPSRWLKEIVTKGLLGKVFQVEVNCYWNRDERYYTGNTWHGTDLDGGTLFTQFSHFVDMLLWLFGDITNIQSRMYSHNHRHLTGFEDSGNILFDFEGGGSGCFTFSTSCWDKNLESSMTIIAENGSVKVGGQYMEKVEYCHVKDYVMPELAPTAPANDYGSYKGSAANHHFVFQNVVDVLKGNGNITTNALEGMRVVDTIEKMYAAALGQPPMVKDNNKNIFK